MDEREIQARAERAMRDKLFPGCVVGVVDATGMPKVFPFGHLTYDANSPPIVADTVYDLASVTKSIVASLMLLVAAENPARLNLAKRVVEYLPELRNDHGATVEDLLTYRVKGPRLSTLQHETCEEIRTHIFENGFDGPPGEHSYTNLPAYLLGIILERVTGETLPSLAHKHFFEPLHMTNTSFFPTAIPTHNPTYRTKRVYVDEMIAPTEIVDGVEIRGIVHDESARVFARAHHAVGHAGLFSTAPDLLNFAEALLQGKLSTVAEGAEKGLGWQVNEPWMGEKRGEKTFGKTGFTGTALICDMQKGIGLVILSNRTYPKRPPDTSTRDLFFASIADIVFA